MSPEELATPLTEAEVAQLLATLGRAKVQPNPVANAVRRLAFQRQTHLTTIRLLEGRVAELEACLEKLEDNYVALVKQLDKSQVTLRSYRCEIQRLKEGNLTPEESQAFRDTPAPAPLLPPTPAPTTGETT